MALLKNPELLALMNELVSTSLETDDVCNICTTRNDVTSVTLSCKHKFHESCLLKSFRCQYPYGYHNRECPYCRQVVYLDAYKSTCVHTLSRGPSKGKLCGKTCHSDAKLCTTHCNQILKKEQKKAQKLPTKKNTKAPQPIG